MHTQRCLIHVLFRLNNPSPLASQPRTYTSSTASQSRSCPKPYGPQRKSLVPDLGLNLRCNTNPFACIPYGPLGGDVDTVHASGQTDGPRHLQQPYHAASTSPPTKIARGWPPHCARRAAPRQGVLRASNVRVVVQGKLRVVVMAEFGSVLWGRGRG